MPARESSDGDDPADDALAALKLDLSWSLTGTARLWRNLLDERLTAVGQTRPRWRVLAWVQMLPGIRQTDLAERMGIANPTLVRILDHLEAQSLIQRREHTGDRRIKEIHLTDRARPLVEAIAGEIALIRGVLLEDVTPEELRACIAVLDRIRARVPALSGSASGQSVTIST